MLAGGDPTVDLGQRCHGVRGSAENSIPAELLVPLAAGLGHSRPRLVLGVLGGVGSLPTALAQAQALAPWRRPLARHDPGKILLDLAVGLAVGGDCLADVGQLRAAPEMFGPVASDPTVSRLIDTLAADATAALASARATARARDWAR